eukprot:Rhum_TRINITY_DN14411_c4_g1::Rhum_TRINITY_DN14411_c4_g1_i2::g.87436::m.87436
MACFSGILDAAGLEGCVPPLRKQGIDTFEGLCNAGAKLQSAVHGDAGKLLALARLCRPFEALNLEGCALTAVSGGVLTTRDAFAAGEGWLDQIGVHPKSKWALTQLLNQESVPAQKKLWDSTDPVTRRAVKSQVGTALSWAAADDCSSLLLRAALGRRRSTARTAAGSAPAPVSESLPPPPRAAESPQPQPQPQPQRQPAAENYQQWSDRSLHVPRHNMPQPQNAFDASGIGLALDDLDLPPPPAAVENTEYYLNGEIGKGSFGVVYKASSSTGSKHAIKEIELANEEAAVEAANEYKLLIQLDHKNIVKVDSIYAEETEDGRRTLNIVMELISGGELDRVMSECDNAIQAVKGYAYQILNGLRYLHQKGIVHGDIKPKNILVEAPNTLKLTDFGLSNVITKDEKCGEKKTGFGGTLLYQSPSLVDTRVVTMQSDIWAFACTVLELATSQRPWSEKSFGNDAQCLVHIASCCGTDQHPSLSRCKDDVLISFLEHAFSAERHDFKCADIFKHPFLSIDQPGVSVLADQLRHAV